MLNIEELNKINTYLCYLVSISEEAKLTTEMRKEIMNLGCRCLDMVDEIERIKEFTEK